MMLKLCPVHGPREAAMAAATFYKGASEVRLSSANLAMGGPSGLQTGTSLTLQIRGVQIYGTSNWVFVECNLCAVI